MISNFNSKNRKDDVLILSLLIVVSLFVVWLCTPPGNKFAQLCFFGNNTKFFVAKLTKPTELTDWVFHRNNAIYLARMDNKKQALREMDRAVANYPTYASDIGLDTLYKERAILRTFFHEYSKALDDYLRVKSGLNWEDRLRIAQLYKINGKSREALSWCNSMLDLDPNAYVGYACIADIYANAGRPDVSVKVFDLLIERVKNRGAYYVDRAMYKRMIGQFHEAEEDIDKAKSLQANIDSKNSILTDITNPKILKLEILKK